MKKTKRTENVSITTKHLDGLKEIYSAEASQSNNDLNPPMLKPVVSEVVGFTNTLIGSSSLPTPAFNTKSSKIVFNFTNST